MMNTANLTKNTKTGLRLSLMWIVFVFLAASCDDDDINLSPLPDLTITEIAPLTARAGEELVITGTGFDTEYISRNDVEFTDEDGSPVINDVIVKKATTTQLTVIVPDRSTINGPVKVTVKGQEAVSSQDFVVDNSVPPMPAPVISEVSPISGFANDEVIISGEYFVDDDILPTVFLGMEEVEPTSISMDEIIFTVPEDMEAGEVMITVQRGGLTSNEALFTINAIPVAVTETFWSESTNGGSIKRGIIQENGAQIETVFQGSASRGVALDMDSELIYFVHHQLEIFSMPIDGNGTPQTIVDLNIDSSIITDIALNRETNTLYFLVEETGLDTDTWMPFIHSHLYKGDIATGNVEILYSIDNVNAQPSGLKINTASGKLYMTVTELDLNTGVSAGVVYEGNLNGSGTLNVLFGASDGLAGARNIALHPETGKLYIIDNNGSTSTIYSGNIDGSGGLEVFASSTDIGGSEAQNISDLEIDAENGFLFWIYDNSNGAIKRAALDGSGIENLFSGIDGGKYFDLMIE